MVKSYCVKQKKETECVEPSGYKTAKNGRLMFWCSCAECGIKAFDYALDKLSPVIQNVGSQALDQLSTKIRPTNYKTNRKDLDGGALDIHKLIGKLPKPKAGWTPGNYKYMGPYNPLDKQLEYDEDNGEITKWHVKTYNKVDEIAAYHDVCFDIGKNKGDCDKAMIKSLDEIPYGEMPKWGQTARFLIDQKHKLGPGLN